MLPQTTPSETNVEPEYPVHGTPGEKLRFLLQYAVLAPSERNSQPWLFQICGDQSELYVELFVDRTRAVHEVDPNERELLISCGAALYHFCLALRYFGHTGSVEILPDASRPDVLARVRWGAVREPGPEERLLFHTMRQRHTDRRPFLKKNVPSYVLASLRMVAKEAPIHLHVIKDTARQEVADLVAAADRVQFAEPVFRRELAGWLRRDGSPAGDGVPDSAFGMPDRVSYDPSSLIYSSEVSDLHVERDYQLALEAPVLAVLGTVHDTPRDWLQTGQTLAEMLLVSCAEGLSVSFLNTPIQVPALRAKLSDTLGKRDYPQLMFRIGYGRKTPPTPRRPVGEVLINERPIHPTTVQAEIVC